MGLAKQFVKALNFESEAFKEIKKLFPKLSDAKLQGGISTGPDVRKLLNRQSFELKLTEVEKKAWKVFRNVVQGFLGNRKDRNYISNIKEMINSYKDMGCRMSLKLHFLDSHLIVFKENLGDVSEEAVRDSTKISKQWRQGIRVGGTKE